MNNYYYANGTFFEETADPPNLPTAEQLAAEEQAAAEAAKQVTEEQRENAVDYPEDEALARMEAGELQDEFPEENFRVVEPPIGATVSLIPEDAEEKTVGNLVQTVLQRRRRGLYGDSRTQAVGRHIQFSTPPDAAAIIFGTLVFCSNWGG
jgi:hypothetical protein